MKAIEKLIFNELACRRGVNLPGVGSLFPEFWPARMRDRKILETPSVQILFSHDESPAWPALPALIAREGAMDEESALAEYDRWLHDARKEQTIVIGETGEIRQGHFVPTPELNALLNPEGRPSSIRLRTRRKPLRMTLGVLAVLAVCLMAALWLHHDAFRFLAFLVPAEPPAEIVLHNPGAGECPLQADTMETAEIPMVSDSTATGSEATPVASASLPQSEESSPDATPPAPDRETYHLVAGVFSTAGNADRFIANTKEREPSLIFQKILTPNGKIMVSIFSSSDRSAVEHRLKEKKFTCPDCWIHEVR